MEKISGIIPANSRTSTADVSTAQPARPGAPAAGRVAGRGTDAVPIEDRVSFMHADRLSANPAGVYKANPDAARAKVVQDMASKFFESQAKFNGIRPNGESQTEAVAESVEETPVRQLPAR